MEELRLQEALLRLESQLRMADDHMQRARDQLEESNPDMISLTYAEHQLDKAADRMVEANFICRQMIADLDWQANSNTGKTFAEVLRDVNPKTRFRFLKDRGE